MRTTISGRNPTIIHLEGKLDVAHSLGLRQTLREQITSAEDNFIVDLGEVELIDSAGLSVLVSAQRTADAAGARLRFANLSPAVRATLEVTRVIVLLDLVEPEPLGAAAA